MAKISEKICHGNAGIFLFTPLIIESSYVNRKCYINGLNEVEVHETIEKNGEWHYKIILVNTNNNFYSKRNE